MKRKQVYNFGTFPQNEAERIARAVKERFKIEVVAEPIRGTSSDYANVNTPKECVIALDTWSRVKGFVDGMFYADCH